MTWKKLLTSKSVSREPPSKTELDNLRSIVARSLKDVEAAGLSADARIVMAYDAARTLSLMVVRAAGYRPRAIGGYYNTFLGLEAADAAFANQAAYFDSCRLKRNGCQYDFAGGVSETDAEGLLKAAKQFAIDVESWIKARDPSLS